MTTSAADTTDDANDEQAHQRVRAERVLFWSGFVIAALAVATYIKRVKLGLTISEWTDEDNNFVVAKMMYYGKHAYGDIFVHQGALPYLITHLYSLVVSESDFSYVRLTQVLLALTSLTALVLSPAFRKRAGRVWAGALYLLFISSVWNLEGLNTLTYWTMGSFLFVIIISQSVVPLVVSNKPSSSGLFASGAAISLVCFCGYSNGPAVILFALASTLLLLSKEGKKGIVECSKPLMSGIGVATLAMGIWLWKFGDLKGFLVYHFYFNQQIHSKYIEFSPTDVFKNLAFSFAAKEIVHTWALLLFSGWLYIFASLETAYPPGKFPVMRIAALVIVAAAVLFTNPRGELIYGSLGFVTTNLALFAMAYALVLEKNLVWYSIRGIVHWGMLFFAIAFLSYQVGAYAIPWFGKKDMVVRSDALRPGEGKVYEFIRRITKKQGDLLALNYNQVIYLKTDRIPASGSYYSVMDEEEYNRHPKLGYKIDVCTDIQMRRPAVIWFFNWRVWDKYSLEEYKPCILSLLTEGYRPVTFNSPWHIRNDLFDAAMRIAPRNLDEEFSELDFGWLVVKVMRPSAPLSIYADIKIKMSPNHEAKQLALKRIGIMFGTYGRQNPGEAELHLEGPNHAELVKRFTLTALRDNKYYYFDLDSKQYASGEILAVDGGGASTWESSLDWDSGAPAYTCVIYEYIDGTKSYTPSCPIM